MAKMARELGHDLAKITAPFLEMEWSRRPIAYPVLRLFLHTSALAKARCPAYSCNNAILNRQAKPNRPLQEV
jgi:hypothetical protein